MSMAGVVDVPKGTLHLELSDEEIAVRKKQLTLPANLTGRGYTWLYQTHVEQAHLGADMDFLKGGSGSEVLRDSH